jgi:hypothetical protein
MLLALIYVLIVVVIGTICFYLIDKFVRDGGSLITALWSRPLTTHMTISSHFD